MKLLIAEQDQGPHEGLEEMAKAWGYDPVCAKHGGGVLEIMRQKKAPRLLLLDNALAGLRVEEVCQRLCLEEETFDPPYVLLILSSGGTEEVARAFEAGASDCLRRPFDHAELHARLKVGERTLKLQRELHRVLRHMTRLAMRDPLTKLYNRRAMLERLEQEMARGKRFGTGLHVGIADLDHFKKINYHHGHHAGDTVIRAFARGAISVMRNSDILGRWGGEEFVILAPDSTSLEINPVFERVRQRTAESEITVGKSTIKLTVSIGTAAAASGESPDSLLRRAYLALYQEKKSGRNRVCHAHPPSTKNQTPAKLY